jgi:hypothetical protein
MKVPLGRVLAIAIFCVLPARWAPAQVLIDPTVSSFSSEMTEYQNIVNLHREASNVVNGSGLTAGPSTILGASDSTAGTVSDTNEWWTVGNTTGATPGSPDYAPSITFNLGSVYNLTTLRIWNVNQNDAETGNNPAPQLGAQSVAVYAGLTLNSLSLVGTETFSEGTGSPLLPQDISVNIPDVQFVEYRILTNWDGAVFGGTAGTSSGGNDGRGLVGLSEVRFEGDVVPEPSTWAMLLAGLVVLGLGVRRIRGRQ